MIEIKKVVASSGEPAIAVETSDSNIPRRGVIMDGGSEPVIEPLDVTENGTYTPETGVDGFSPVMVNVPTGDVPYSPSLFKIVESLPATPTNEAIYLIPNGDQIFPACSTVCDYVIDPYPNLPLIHYVTVIADYHLVGDTDRVSAADLPNITKYWLFDGERTQPHTRYSNGNDITYGSSSRATPPALIYEYDTEHPELGWVDITANVTQEIWEAGTAPVHTTNAIVFSNLDVIRNTSGMEVYTQLYNICDKTGKVSNIYQVNTFDVYYVDNGVAVSKGIKKTMLEVYEMLINGDITPTILGGE